MIYLQSGGRLGNQFFKYAFARKLQIDRGDTLTINFPQLNRTDNTPTWDNQLQYFNIPKDIIFTYNKKRTIFQNGSVKQKILFNLNRVLRRPFIFNYKILRYYQNITTPFFNTNGLYLQNKGYTPYSNSKYKNILIAGLYESAKYFTGIEYLLRHEFSPKRPKLEKNSHLYKIINENDSVCVNVRRGDYLLAQNKMFNVCSEGYYKNAVKKMKEIRNNVVFIVFSNDIPWCKNFFCNISGKFYFEAGDDPVWEVLRLMYSCKHFIISNSTLAWWAQFLGKYENKIVVSPGKWYTLKNFDSPLLEDNFIKIPTDDIR
jgi:hypothetical protein